MSVAGARNITMDTLGGADAATLARRVAPITRTCHRPAKGIFLSVDRG
jgi:hypothetical protein